MLYPPPGNTNTAAPVFFSLGGVYTVIVGFPTSVKRTRRRPAMSGLLSVVVSCSTSAALSPGAPLGQISDRSLPDSRVAPAADRGKEENEITSSHRLTLSHHPALWYLRNRRRRPIRPAPNIHPPPLAIPRALRQTGFSMLSLHRAGALLLLGAAFLAAQQPQPKRPVMPDDVIFEPGLEYSPTVGGKLALDIVRPRNNQGVPHPAVLCIHGGGFRAGNRESYLPLCIRLAQHGYVAATVTYRLAPKFQFPAPLHDVKAAVRYLRANAAKFGIDPDRIGVTGGSAGGTLALLLGVTPGIAEFEGYGPNLDQSSSVKCVVDYYGATDFTKSYGHSVDAAEVLPQFLGGDLEHARLAHMKSSPLYWVSPSSAPVLIVHGTKDRYVQFDQSLWLVDRMKAVGVPVELEPMEGSDHGFKGDYLVRADKLLIDYFDKHLAQPKEERRILVSNHGAAGEIMALSWPSGEILWRVPNQHGHDVQGLLGGHVLYTIGAAHKSSRDGCRPSPPPSGSTAQPKACSIPSPPSACPMATL